MDRGLLELSDVSYAKLPLLYRIPRDMNPLLGIPCILMLAREVYFHPYWGIAFCVAVFLWDKEREKRIAYLYQQEVENWHKS
jgi:hypothetical protein